MATPCALPVPTMPLEQRLQPIGNTFLNWACPDVEPPAKARARSFPGYIPHKLVNTAVQVDEKLQEEIHNAVISKRRGSKMLAARPAALQFVKEKLIVDKDDSGGADKTPYTASTRCSDTWADAESDDDDDDFGSEEPEVEAKAATKVSSAPPVMTQAQEATHAQSADLIVETPEAEKVTTLMLRNLPQSISQRDLCVALDRAGFAGKYDFLYMPTVFSSGVGKGYAFVNFTAPEYADRLLNSWTKGRPFGRMQNKTIGIIIAHIQGRDANIAQWDTPKMRRVRNPNHRPLVLAPGTSGSAPAGGRRRASV
mmetsp:Transcript_138101/g.385292  ORF Transcript_138101/g.385292 Transcript_138101/m.385292 type:complete len:311 (+) Transcript_138101:98-1030(+)